MVSPLCLFVDFDYECVIFFKYLVKYFLSESLTFFASYVICIFYVIMEVIFLHKSKQYFFLNRLPF